MIAKFIAGLNDLQKKLLFLALAIVVIALFDRLLIGPTMSRLSSIDSEIVHEESDIKQDLRFLSYKERIVKEHESVSPYFMKNIPTEEELIAGFLKRLEGLAAQAKVNIAKVTPSAGNTDKEYLRYDADLECSGKLADVVSFMHLINTSDELLKVVKYTLSGKKSDSDDIKATMTVQKIIVAVGNEKPKPSAPKDADTASPNEAKSN